MKVLAAFLCISVTIQPLLFVYYERCQAPYMHLTNDHFLSQTTGGERTFFMVLCYCATMKKSWGET